MQVICIHTPDSCPGGLQEPDTFARKLSGFGLAFERADLQLEAPVK